MIIQGCSILKFSLRRHTVNWPALSPGPSADDFFLWGYLKGKVYQERPDTIQDFKDKIRTEIQEIPWALLHRLMDSLCSRLRVRPRPMPMAFKGWQRICGGIPVDMVEDDDEDEGWRPDPVLDVATPVEQHQGAARIEHPRPTDESLSTVTYAFSSYACVEIWGLTQAYWCTKLCTAISPSPEVEILHEKLLPRRETDPGRLVYRQTRYHRAKPADRKDHTLRVDSKGKTSFKYVFFLTVLEKTNPNHEKREQYRLYWCDVSANSRDKAESHALAGLKVIEICPATSKYHRTPVVERGSKRCFRCPNRQSKGRNLLPYFKKDPEKLAVDMIVTLVLTIEYILNLDARASHAPSPAPSSTGTSRDWHRGRKSNRALIRRSHVMNFLNCFVNIDRRLFDLQLLRCAEQSVHEERRTKSFHLDFHLDQTPDAVTKRTKKAQSLVFTVDRAEAGGRNRDAT
ncbi:hypothetical protein ANN_22914 [Periplaneta americana]|uniref:Uncharacterized protein n=1 Tax=Periplaneta americana TaxID=6978 RepID=A0ABQ8SLL2_PERAM|nr:hypothetical protein ANN_22914 [Periplaneta americana]